MGNGISVQFLSTTPEIYFISVAAQQITTNFVALNDTQYAS